ncbi:MAG: sialidase family protein [Gemmatimonadaceae bacterium]
MLSLTRVRFVRATIAITIVGVGCANAGRPPTPSPHVLPRGELVRIDVATSGVGSPYYRIPALAVSNSGTILVAFDARPTLADLPSSIRIVLRRSRDGGRTFGDQIIVRAGDADHGYGDPSFVVDRRTGRIFLFYAAGMRQGFAGSHKGTDVDDPDILQTDYSYSDDDGSSWKSRRITPMIKKADWGGLFAASGAGIQIASGPYAGRLIQQYTVRHNGANWAASAFSDDDGTTWHMGHLIGPGADENKSAELANGTLMLNIRAKPYRKVAYSSDGGETWHSLHDDPNLIDPGNNGSVIRYNDSASRATHRSSLLFSNTESASDRRNLTVKLSCDDGRTWPVRRTVESGASEYSSLADLGSGKFALLYERGDYTHITLAIFDSTWLPASCSDYRPD